MILQTTTRKLLPNISQLLSLSLNTHFHPKVMLATSDECLYAFVLCSTSSLLHLPYLLSIVPKAFPSSCSFFLHKQSSNFSPDILNNRGRSLSDPQKVFFILFLFILLCVFFFNAKQQNIVVIFFILLACPSPHFLALPGSVPKKKIKIKEYCQTNF